MDGAFFQLSLSLSSVYVVIYVLYAFLRRPSRLLLRVEESSEEFAARDGRVCEDVLITAIKEMEVIFFFFFVGGESSLFLVTLPRFMKLTRVLFRCETS